MKIHIVKKGDTMYLIAKKYNVSLEDLIKANPEIANPDKIDVGMKVKIPAPPQPTYELIHQHKVQQGDTLWKLSKAWGVPLADMIKANPHLKNPNVLLTGEIVNIPKVPATGGTGSGSNPKAAQTAKKPTGVKPETGVIEPAAVAPLPEPLPVLPEPPPMPLPEPLPVKPEMEKPKEVQPVQKPVEKPKAVEPQPKPLEKPKTVEPLQKPAEMPAVKETFPVETKYEQDLFAQFPIPAVEAGAQAPEYPSLPVNVPMPVFGAEMAKDLPAPSVESMAGKMFDWYSIGGHDSLQGFGDISNVGAQNLVSPANTQVQDFSSFMPANMPGMVSPQMMAMPSSGCKTCGGKAAQPMQAMNMPYTGQWAQTLPATGYPGIGMMPSSVLPAADAYPNMGYPGTNVMPSSVLPAVDAYPNMGYSGANVMPSSVLPAVDAYPNMGYPGANVMPSSVLPAADAYPNMGYPGANIMPSSVLPAADVYPNMGYPGANIMPANVSPAVDVYPNMGYPGANVMPANVSPAAAYPNMSYPQTDFMPANVSPAMAYPNMGYPGKDIMPDYLSPAGNAMSGKDLPPHYPFDPLYIPPVPPLPPLRENDGGGENPLSLHAAEEEGSAEPASSKKRQAIAKKKSQVRRAKRKSKESLPWIK